MLDYMADPDARSLAQLIVSFANASGGTIIIGMDADGRVQGDVAEHLEPVLRRALLLCQPRFGEADLSWYYEDLPEGQVAAIIVRPTPYQMSIEGREVYVRSGRSNLRLEADRAERITSAYPISFEDQSVAGATLQDLDEEIVEEYRQNRIRRGPSANTLSRQELLRDAGALDPSGNPTGAGILLFGRNPQEFFPQVGVVIVRFRGTSVRESAQGAERYNRRIELSGPAPRLVERTWQALFDEIHASSVTNGLERQERYDYPPEAVREAVVNAICHRDYTSTGQRIEIRLFDDHMEITSPGRLPGHITLDNMLDEHFSRNPRLVRGLFYWGYIEELGQGIDIMIDAMRREHHPAPAFTEGARSFTVSFSNAVDRLEIEYGEDLSARQLLALRFLQENERITNREYRQLCPDVTAETLRLDLRDLMTRGIIIQVGSKRGTYYVLK
jgi:ATP-dependent DNA helicase RecG